MKDCYGVVSEDFIRKRDEMVKKDNRDIPLDHKYQRWDCEWVEEDQASKHDHLVLTEGNTRFEYDIWNEQTFTRQDYKFVAYSGLHIANTVLTRINKRLLDEIVGWKFRSSRWKDGKYRQLEAGEKVHYTVFDPLPAEYVAENLEENRFTKEFT